MVRAKKQKPIDLKELMARVGADFPTFQILDQNGKIVNEDLVPSSSDEKLVELMTRMVRFRVLDQRSIALNHQGRLGSFVPTVRREASQLASRSAMEKEDYLLPGYRDVPQLVQHDLSLREAFLWSRGHVAGNYYVEDLNVSPPRIIIGARYVRAAGVALGLKKRGKENVILTHTGNGGPSQGDFYKAISSAGVYQANDVSIIQNNGFAISTPHEKQAAAKTLVRKVVVIGIPGIQIDGMDSLAVYAIAKGICDWSAVGSGPVLTETLTCRYGPHTLFGDNPTCYRSKGTDDEWVQKDSLTRFRKYLTDKGLWLEAKEEIKAATAEVDKAPKQKVSDFLKNMFEAQP